MNLPQKTFYIGIAALAIFTGILMLGMLGSFQQIFLVRNVFSAGNPVAVFGIFAIVVFGGIYLLKAGGQIIKAVFRQ